MTKNLLIVGGTGFIGRHLVLRCLKKKWNVTSISLNKKKNKVKKINKVNYLYFDIGNYKNILTKLKNIKYDAIVNLGGHINHKEKNKTYNSHYRGFKNLFKFAKIHKIKKIIQIGSSVEYGFVKSPVGEDTQINKNKLKSVYGLSKYMATELLTNSKSSNDQTYYILRPFLIYGPGQDNSRLIPFVINQCLKGNKFPCSSGNQYRDFLYVTDFIDLIIKCLLNKNKEANNKIINAASGKPIKVKNIINFIQKKIKKGKPDFGKLKLRKDEPKKLYAKNDLAKKLFNWKQKVNLNKGIGLTINFYKKNLI